MSPLSYLTCTIFSSFLYILNFHFSLSFSLSFSLCLCLSLFLSLSPLSLSSSLFLLFLLFLPLFLHSLVLGIMNNGKLHCIGSQSRLSLVWATSCSSTVPLGVCPGGEAICSHQPPVCLPHMWKPMQVSHTHFHWLSFTMHRRSLETCSSFIICKLNMIWK